MASTVTGTNVGLTRAGAAVPATLSYDAAAYTVSLQPQRALDLLASYTVTVGTDLKDVAGNSLAADQSWSFKTADGTWQTASRLDAANAVSLNPDIAIDADGNAVALWASQASSGYYEIRAATYGASSGWGSVATVSTNSTYDALVPKVRLDGQGNALAIWAQVDGAAPGNGLGLWSARYVKGQGWQAPVLVSTYLPSFPEVSFALDASGNAIAAWTQSVGPGLSGNMDIWAARFTPAGGWQAATRVGSSANIGTFDSASEVNVVMDEAGDAYVLWIQTASSNPVWFARYQAGSGWQAAVSLGAQQLGYPFAPKLAVSASGQVVALWNTFVYAGGPYRFDLWWSALDAPGGGWSTPALLENDDAGDARNQAVVADSAGHFHAVWQQYASTYNSNLQHRQYTPGSGWGTTETISTASGTYDQNRSPSLVADRNGNLMAVWGVYASGNGGAQEGTFARRYIAGEGWQPTNRLDLAQGGSALSTSLAVNPSGLIAATWMEPTLYRSDGPVWVNLLR